MIHWRCSSWNWKYLSTACNLSSEVYFQQVHRNKKKKIEMVLKKPRQIKSCRWVKLTKKSPFDRWIPFNLFHVHHLVKPEVGMKMKNVPGSLFCGQIFKKCEPPLLIRSCRSSFLRGLTEAADNSRLISSSILLRFLSEKDCTADFHIYILKKMNYILRQEHLPAMVDGQNE